MKRLRIFSLALTCLLLLSSHRAFGASGVHKPCDLLSQQSAEKLFGGPLDPPRDMMVACAFFGPHGDDKKGIVVTLMMSAAMGGVASIKTMYNSMLHSDPSATLTPVSGLGEEAHFITAKDGMLTLVVLDHGNAVGLGETASHNPRIKDDLIQTIRQMMQKL